MEGGPDSTNGLALAVRPGTIGEQYDGELAFEIDPQGSSRIAEMAGRVAAKESAGGGRLGGCIPSQRSGAFCRQGAASEESNRLRCEKLPVE